MLGHLGPSLFITMKKTNKSLLKKKGTHELRAKQPSYSKGRFLQAIRNKLSESLIKNPLITIAVIILCLLVIPLVVRWLLQIIEAIARDSGIQWLSLNGSLGNWFAFFGSYCGAIATVVLGVLAARLTVKQDQSNNYADISNLRLNNFFLFDLWRDYQPSIYGEDIGRRFILTFEIEGLKTYYNIKEMKASWSSSVSGGGNTTLLRNLKVKLERRNYTRVILCFDDFTDCDVRNSFNYFFRLGCYEYKMMSPCDKQRWLNLQFEIHYGDGSNIRYVDCDCCLEYAGVKKGSVVLALRDHIISINSRRVEK